LAYNDNFFEGLAPASDERMRAFREVCSVYLLYWYKSTHTDTHSACECGAHACVSRGSVLNLLDVLVQKYKY
jgi:hypothetical protein